MIVVACFCLWFLFLSSTQNKISSETVSNSVYHAKFSEIALLHGRFSMNFPMNLLHDLVNKFFEKHLKAASERVSLLGDWKSSYLTEQAK